MGRGEYIIKDLYQPGYSSFKPGENLVPNYLGKQNMVSAGSLGIATNPTVANQIGELSKLLNTGAIPIEVGALDIKTFDSIPLEHWDEMRRKADLNDAKVTLHAPLIDPSGINENRWDETQQKIAQRQFIQIVDRAFQITSKKNSTPVPITIHPGNYAGSSYVYETDPETKKRNKVAEQLVVINKERGELVPIARDEKYQLGSKNFGKKESAEDMLKSANDSQWRKEIDKVIYEKESADKSIDKIFPAIKPIYSRLVTGQISPDQLQPEHIELIDKLKVGQIHLQDARLSLNSVFEKAYKYGTEESRKKLKEISENFAKEIGANYDEKDFNKLSKEKQMEILNNQIDLQHQSKIIQQTAEALRNFNPQLFQRVEDFAIDKASETLKNVALHAYDRSKELKIVAPQLSIENLYQGLSFSQTEDVAKVIEKTRKEFQLSLMNERGLSSTEAQKQAEKMIGATFDVGHLNLSRKHGFTEEDMKKEAQAIAKYVNKVHLTDNFGNVDTHLPLGMGNVPVELLLDALGDAGKNAVKINEIGGYTMNFGKVAYAETLGAFGSPIYSSGDGPYWSQTTGFQQSYSTGFGSFLPQINYETFGAGFSGLPQELGGSKSTGSGGRMGGGY